MSSPSLGLNNTKVTSSATKSSGIVPSNVAMVSQYIPTGMPFYQQPTVYSYEEIQMMQQRMPHVVSLFKPIPLLKTFQKTHTSHTFYQHFALFIIFIISFFTTPSRTLTISKFIRTKKTNKILCENLRCLLNENLSSRKN